MHTALFNLIGSYKSTETQRGADIQTHGSSSSGTDLYLIKPYWKLQVYWKPRGGLMTYKLMVVAAQAQTSTWFNPIESCKSTETQRGADIQTQGSSSPGTLPYLTLLEATSLLKAQRGAHIKTQGSSSPGTDLYLI